MGTVVGPAAGAVLYLIGGYKFMFFSFGILFVVVSFFIKVIFKSDIDELEEMSTNEQQTDNFI